jgi:hypothetical protein
MNIMKDANSSLTQVGRNHGHKHMGTQINGDKYIGTEMGTPVRDKCMRIHIYGDTNKGCETMETRIIAQTYGDHHNGT